MDTCTHPRATATPVLGKICTYECGTCGVEFTRTAKEQNDAPDEGPRKMDDAQFGMALQLVNVAQATFAGWRMQMAMTDAQPDADILLISAMASFAGTIYGGLVGMGCAKSDDDAVAAIAESMALNFMRGMDAGVNAYAREAAKAMQEAGEPN